LYIYAPSPELLAIYPVIHTGLDVETPVVTVNKWVELPDPELVNVFAFTIPDRTP
jgi:hypothetical protein